MAGAKKFGTFGGVFTPSILTILGVIMYMRMGWVVGNAGLYGAIIIVLIAHVISITTGLSISSIATDKKVGAGGVYYVLSRSLGLPIGGAIGVTLFSGTALSIALYLVGFAESFNAYLGLDTSINSLRIAGTIALVSLATIALISTAIAIKTQYFIMGAIGLSLISIFFGSWEFAPAVVPLFGDGESVPMETVFAIFFPAVTGFTAGIAMSGDLADPKKSIPAGTIAAIVVGFVIYIVLAIFLAYAIDPLTLRSDYNILLKIAVFAPAVAAGIWGATLSSALGGILGGPRILQAMSVDKITPKFFGKGVGKDNEPRNALLLTLVIAECGVLIGELDLIARVVSMFYLAAYGFINLSFFLESWASADFSPSFKVKRWIGLVGFIATFTVMFKLDMMAMFAAFIIIGGIYAYLQRKQLALGSGDIWNSVWSSLVLTGLKRMDKSEDHNRNWKPNILLFSGSTETRPHLIEIAKNIAGKVGMISNFHLVENSEAKVLFPKHKQSIHDPILVEQGIFGRQQEVKNIYEGIETIASTYGFSGVEPNTVLLGWAKNTKDPLMFTQMTQKLIELDYNVLYLDYDWNKKFGKYQRIDIWWQNLKNNAELTLNIAKFISNSPQWRKATIRLILINDTNKEGFERKMHQLLDAYRIEAIVKVINNHLERKSSFDLMKSNSDNADLIIAGIPDIPSGEEKDFVDNTTEMFGVLGTTLLVKTSSILGEDENQELMATPNIREQDVPGRFQTLVPFHRASDPLVQESIDWIRQEIEEQSADIVDSEIASFQNIYTAFARECRKEALALVQTAFSEEASDGPPVTDVKDVQKQLLELYQNKVEHFENEDLPYLEEKLANFHEKYAGFPQKILSSLPEKIKVEGKKVALRKLAKDHFDNNYQNALHDLQYQIGYSGYELNEAIKDSLIESVRSLNADLDMITKTFEELVLNMKNRHFLLGTAIRNKGRVLVNTLIRRIEHPADFKTENDKTHNRKALKALMQENAVYKDYWRRNESRLTARLVTDLKLQQINLVIEQIGESIQEEMQGSMFQTTAQRLEEAEQWLDSLGENPEVNSYDLPEVNQSLTYDDQKIEELMLLSESMGKNLPEQLELIEPDSLLALAHTQGEALETVTIDARATYGYLIYDKLQQPLQKHLLSAYQDCMETLSRVQYDLNQIVQKMNYLKDDATPDNIPEMVLKAKANIVEFRQELRIHLQQKGDLLHDIIHTANGSLNTASLLEHEVRILPAVLPNSNKKGIKRWLGKANDTAGTLIEKMGILMASQREMIQPSYGDHRSTDMHYELKKFVNQLTVEEKIAETLPFYYKQLFLGKPAPALDQLHHREKELQQAFTMLRSPNTEERQIVVLGEPLSGKSYFSETVARAINKGQVIKIQAPVSGSTDKLDLIKTLQKQLKSNTKNSNILKEAPVGTIFLLEDLELWWDRGKPDGKLIRFIVKLINLYKSRFSFIINCNIYAFKIMEGQGLLNHLTASRIYLSHFELPAIHQLLMQRHESGGLRLTLKGKDQEEISKKNLRKLMGKYLQSSNGIVGVALQQWVSNIRGYQEDLVEVDFPKDMALPTLEDKEYLLVLSQFLIHKHLDAARLQKLFGYTDRTKADQIIRQLSADGLIRDIMGSTYQLNPLVVVWLINRAREFSLI